MSTPKIIKILEAPPSQWPALINSSKLSLNDIEGGLIALAQRAALLGDYVAFRFNTGCGDQGHEAAAKHANRTLCRVRKALGFTYHNNPSIRIS